MTETDVNLPPPWDLPQLDRGVDALFARHGLLVTMKGTLKTHPGCTHWHLKHRAAAGTLEFTLWPDRRRAWFQVQAGRAAEWIGAMLPSLKAELEQGELHGE